MAAMKKWLGRAVMVLAVGYPVALLVAALLLRYRGEQWWATGVGLYLPRIGFALPLPVLVALLFMFRLRKLLWTQVVAALIVIFPLMGLVLSWPGGSRDGAPTIRILSFNVDSGYYGVDKIDQQIQLFSPDIVLLQEAFEDGSKLADVFRSRYPSVENWDQFIVASKFPIIEVTDPERKLFQGRLHTTHYLRLVVESSIGRIAVYNVHTLSPRSVFYKLRGRGLTREILTGHAFSGWASESVDGNNEARAFQIEAAADAASQEQFPVVVAGDTNLPGLSQTFGKFLGQFQDGFTKAGNGFGYTFKSEHPWMRLDRILASDELRFTRFEVGCPDASDHLCVVADLQRR